MDEFGNTIHVIDGVLEAQFLLSEARFTRERSTHWEVSGEANISTALGWAADSDSYAVVVGGLLTLSSWTLFLPSNDALAALPTEWRTKLQSDVSLSFDDPLTYIICASLLKMSKLANIPCAFAPKYPGRLPRRTSQDESNWSTDV